MQVDVRVFDGGCAGLYHLRLEDHTRRALPPHLGAQRLAWQHRRREACAHRVEARLRQGSRVRVGVGVRVRFRVRVRVRVRVRARVRVRV